MHSLTHQRKSFKRIKIPPLDYKIKTFRKTIGATTIFKTIQVWFASISGSESIQLSPLLQNADQTNQINGKINQSCLNLKDNASLMLS